MGSGVDYPGSSPGYHLLPQFFNHPSFPQLKNGGNNSAYFTELLYALNSVSGTEPRYRISYRIYMSSKYIQNAYITVPGTEEVLNKFQYNHSHHYQALGRD